MATESKIRLAGCEACGNRVSTQACACPACGHRVPATPEAVRRKVVVGRALLGLVAVACLFLLRSPGLTLITAFPTFTALALSVRRPRVAIFGGYAVLGVLALLALSWAT